MSVESVRTWAACLATAALAACSPYVYRAEVTAFDDGVVQATKMLDGQREFLAANAAAIRRADLVERNFPRVQIDDRCADATACLEKLAANPADACAAGLLSPAATGQVPADAYVEVAYFAAASCELRFADGGPVDLPVPASAQRNVLYVLDDYATALAGIVSAEDRKALAASAAKACGTAQALFVTTAGLQARHERGGDAAAQQEAAQREAERKARVEAQSNAVGSVCGLVAQAGIALLDRKRLQVLTQVVDDADPVVQTLATYLQRESRRISAMMIRASLNATLDAFEGTIGGTEDAQADYYRAIDDSALARAKLVALLRERSDDVFIRMADAHHALRQAIHDPATQLKPAIAAIDEFVRSAKQAYDAVRALRAREPH